MSLVAVNRNYNPATIAQLLERNEEFKRKFSKNKIFQLVKSGYLSSEDSREIFFSYLQIWSNCFQKVMLLKTALCDDPIFLPTFNSHFSEEVGHEQLLKKERKDSIERNDAILEALSSWFPFKMLSFNHYEQIVVVNLCLEGAATVFCNVALPVLDPHKKLQYLQAHNTADAEHEKLGLDLLDNLSESHIKRLLDVQKQSWAVFEALMNRIGELTSGCMDHLS